MPRPGESSQAVGIEEIRGSRCPASQVLCRRSCRYPRLQAETEARCLPGSRKCREAPRSRDPDDIAGMSREGLSIQATSRKWVLYRKTVRQDLVEPAARPEFWPGPMRPGKPERFGLYPGRASGGRRVKCAGVVARTARAGQRKRRHDLRRTAPAAAAGAAGIGRGCIETSPAGHAQDDRGHLWRLDCGGRWHSPEGPVLAPAFSRDVRQSDRGPAAGLTVATARAGRMRVGRPFAGPDSRDSDPGRAVAPLDSSTSEIRGESTRGLCRPCFGWSRPPLRSDRAAPGAGRGSTLPGTTQWGSRRERRREIFDRS